MKTLIPTLSLMSIMTGSLCATITLGDWNYNFANGGAGLTESGSAITSTGDSDGNRSVWAYFAPQTLNTGDALTVSFDLTLQGSALNQGRGIAVGLFSSNGTIQTGAVGGIGNDDMKDDFGYLQSIGTGSNTTSRLESWSGNGSYRTAPLGDETALTTLNNATSLGIADTDTYNVAFTIIRDGTDFSLQTRLDGSLVNSLSGVGTLSGGGFDGTSTYTFDMLGFGIKNFGQDVAFSNIGVEYSGVTAVPEPSTYAMITGGLVLGFILLRRRKS